MIGMIFSRARRLGVVMRRRRLPEVLGVPVVVMVPMGVQVHRRQDHKDLRPQHDDARGPATTLTRAGQLGRSDHGV